MSPLKSPLFLSLLFASLTQYSGAPDVDASVRAKIPSAKATIHKKTKGLAKGRRGKMKADAQKGLALRKQIREFRKTAYGAQSKMVLANMGASQNVKKLLEYSAKGGSVFTISDLHMGRGKNKDGSWKSQEDFTKTDTFERFVTSLPEVYHKPTLVIAGDMLEILEATPASSPIPVVQKVVEQIVRAHKEEFKALTNAVGAGLRIVYTTGNHDIQLVHPEVQQTFISAIIKEAKLNNKEAKVLRERVGFAGHAAFIGGDQILMVSHGHQMDPTNSWKSPVVPFNAVGGLPANMGHKVVQGPFNDVEKRTPNIDNGHDTNKAVAKAVLMNPRTAWKAMKTIASLVNGTESFGAAGTHAEKMNSRVVMKAWVERTGFAEKMSTMLGFRVTQLQAVKAMEAVYLDMPTPVHEVFPNKQKFRKSIETAKNVYTMYKKSKTSVGDMVGTLNSNVGAAKVMQNGHTHLAFENTGTTTEKFYQVNQNTGGWVKTNKYILTVGQVDFTRTGAVASAELMSTMPNGRLQVNTQWRKSDIPAIPVWNQ